MRFGIGDLKDEGIQVGIPEDLAWIRHASTSQRRRETGEVIQVLFGIRMKEKRAGLLDE